MKLLIINSDALFIKDGVTCIDKNTGQFLSDLSNTGILINLYHFRTKHNGLTVADYKIENIDKIKISYTDRSKFKILSYLKAAFKLFKVFKQNEFIYLFYPNAFSFSLLFCYLFNKPFALYLRGEKRINSRLSIILYRHASFVTTISPEYTDMVIKYGGKAFTIRPMIDYGIEDILPNKIKQLKEKYTILFIGRVERDKGIFELIEAVNDLKDKNISNFIINVIGTGEHLGIIEKMIQNYKIEHLITIHGSITDKSIIKHYYKNSDLFILPSHHEGFPRVLYEAMIFDVPIVTTFVGSIPYLMKDDFNCYRINVKSKQSIIEKLEYILKNYSKTEMISQNATITIRQYLKTYSMTHEDIILNQISEVLR